MARAKRAFLSSLGGRRGRSWRARGLGVQPAGPRVLLLNGTVTGAKLAPASVTGANIADNAITAAKIAGGQVVKSLNVHGNLLRDNVTLTAGANVTLTPNGNNVTISSSGAGGTGIWTANGNSTYYTAGNVGIGAAFPSPELDDFCRGQTGIGSLL